MNTPKVWYVTGASQGLGLTLVKKLLDNGYCVAATSRNAQTLKNAVKRQKVRTRRFTFTWGRTLTTGLQQN
jgi:short-subunit dehydrogenase